jgi:hypothetical protein
MVRKPRQKRHWYVCRRLTIYKEKLTLDEAKAYVEAQVPEGWRLEAEPTWSNRFQSFNINEPVKGEGFVAFITRDEIYMQGHHQRWMDTAQRVVG